ncbi:MAG: DUF4437 domain-containing protein [Planctomycetota bacterium]
MKRLASVVLGGLGLLVTAWGCQSAGTGDAWGERSYLPASAVQWGALNPARGDASPRAADLWGDRSADTATGFLVKFVDGFSSPPHIHNVTYRGVVISGEVHNDDPTAANFWMPAGSFWVQPAGEDHITSARGEVNVAYIEIGAGPYLVKPSEEAFAGPEPAINVHAANVVWVDDPSGAQVAYLWGDPQDAEPGGRFVRLPAGFRGVLKGEGATLRAVVVSGAVELVGLGEAGAVVMEPGSYFGGEGGVAFSVVGLGDGASVVYVRAEGRVVVEGE